jgi:hypothetical protein
MILCCWARSSLFWRTVVLLSWWAFQITCICSNTAVRISNLTAWGFVGYIAFYHSSYWCDMIW